MQGILVATRVPELPARDSPTRYGRTEDGREGERERMIGQDDECKSAALDGRVVRHAAVTYLQAPAAGACKQSG